MAVDPTTPAIPPGTPDTGVAPVAPAPVVAPTTTTTTPPPAPTTLTPDVTKAHEWVNVYAALAGDDATQVRTNIFGADGQSFNLGAFIAYTGDSRRREIVNTTLNDPARYATLTDDQKNAAAGLYQYLGYYDAAADRAAEEAARAAALAAGRTQAEAEAAARRARDEQLQTAGRDYLADNGPTDFGQVLGQLLVRLFSAMFGIQPNDLPEGLRQYAEPTPEPTPDGDRETAPVRRPAAGQFYGSRGGSTDAYATRGMPGRPNFDAAPRVTVADILPNFSGSDSERIAAYARAHNMDPRRLQNSLLHTVDSLSTVHPAMRGAAVMGVRALFAEGHPVYIEEGWRDGERQNADFRSGASHARAGDSFHNWGLAVDVRPMLGTRVSDVRRIFDGQIGTASIGDWDPDHHQFIHGIRNIHRLRQAQGIGADGYVNIRSDQIPASIRTANARWQVELAAQGRTRGTPQTELADAGDPPAPSRTPPQPRPAAGQQPHRFG